MATDKTSTLEERLARLKGISPEETGVSLLTSIKKTRSANYNVISAESIKNNAQELNTLADKLNFRARNSDNLTEKIQWLKEAKETKLLAQKLYDKSSTQALYERTNKLKGFSSADTARDVLHDLKEAKSNVRNAQTVKQLSTFLTELKTAISKVINKAVQTNSLQDKTKLIQEAQTAKTLLETKFKQGSNPQSQSKGQSRNEKTVVPPPYKVANNPLHSRLREAMQTADKDKKTASAAVKYYRENKSPVNYINALNAIKTARSSKNRVRVLQEKIKKIETINHKTAQFKNTVNMLKSRHEKINEPTNRKGFSPK